MPTAIKSLFFTESYKFHLYVVPADVHFHYIMCLCDSNRVTPEHTKARTNTRTQYHHVTFLNLYIDATVADAYSNNASKMEVKDVIVAKQKTQYVFCT